MYGLEITDCMDLIKVWKTKTSFIKMQVSFDLFIRPSKLEYLDSRPAFCKNGCVRAVIIHYSLWISPKAALHMVT